MILHSTPQIQIPPLPACPICNRPVALEQAKTDEHGRAIHEDCYLVRVKLEGATDSYPQ
jgi:hypothetical protein